MIVVEVHDDHSGRPLQKHSSCEYVVVAVCANPPAVFAATAAQLPGCDGRADDPDDQQHDGAELSGTAGQRRKDLATLRVQAGNVAGADALTVRTANRGYRTALLHVAALRALAGDLDGAHRPLFVTVTQTVGPHVHTDVTLWFPMALDPEQPITPDPGEFTGWGWYPRAEALTWPAERTDPQLSRFLTKLGRARATTAAGAADAGR